MAATGELLEYAEVFGNLYGTPRAPVEAMVARGRDVLFDVDWQGGQQIRNSSLRDAVVSICLTSHYDTQEVQRTVDVIRCLP